ncbi:hypothetical protein SAMN04488550_0246 [Gordonia malaquae]|nr:hypothetical protein [Gordonia malaquae]SEB52283.1 hypothetical protein SAMN04488550_0246 [Gordonia malaquae]
MTNPFSAPNQPWRQSAPSSGQPSPFGPGPAQSGPTQPWTTAPAQPVAPEWPTPAPPAPADYGWPQQQTAWSAPARQPSGWPQQTPAPLVSERPITTIIAAAALAIAAVITVIQAVRVSMGVYWLGDLATNVTDLDETHTVGMAAEDTVNDVQGWLLAVNYSVAAVAAGLYVLFALSIWRGQRWPRIAAIPLCVISLCALIGLDPGAVLIVVLGIGATVCAWLAPSVAFTNARSGRRSAQVAR